MPRLFTWKHWKTPPNELSIEQKLYIIRTKKIPKRRLHKGRSVKDG